MARASHSQQTSAVSGSNLTSNITGEQLTICAICLEEYNNPKVLPCLHTFCYVCLRRHFEVHKLRNNGRLCCPSCREMLVLPPRGVAGLKDDVVSVRIHELLNLLPLEACVIAQPVVDDETQDDPEPLLGACGGSDDPALSPTKIGATQVEDLKLYQNALEGAVAKLRSQALHMYTYENHVRTTLEAANTGSAKNPQVNYQQQIRG